MNIVPISSMAPISSITPIENIIKPGNENEVSTPNAFKNIYDSLISDVNQTNQNLEGDMVKAAAGELDNPHQLVIDSTKARIALQLVSNVRNNALSAYQDIIKMSI